MEKIVLIDMDHTMVDFDYGYEKGLKEYPGQPFPQSKQGFWYDLPPLGNAIESVKKLRYDGYKIYILTRPSVINSISYSEKRMWIEKYFDYDMCKNLILCYDKTMVKGDYLIDDKIQTGIYEPTWEHIHFGQKGFENWIKVLGYFKK